MRTRTLLLLSIACGLAILLAGGIQLLRIANQEPSPALGVGDSGRAGDAVVVVNGFDERDGLAVVDVTLSGVDDPQGLDGFRLQAPNMLVDVDAAASTCTGFTLAPQSCRLAFSATALDGHDRQLVFRRAEEQVRWILV